VFVLLETNQDAKIRTRLNVTMYVCVLFCLLVICFSLLLWATNIVLLLSHKFTLIFTVQLLPFFKVPLLFE
jgi:hypothetical protein